MEPKTKFNKKLEEKKIDPQELDIKEETEHIEEMKWVPRTNLGKEILAGNFSTIKEVLFTGKRIIEPEITDFLVPDMEYEFVDIGQSKGKFGGGRRKNVKATQKAIKEGSRMNFSMLCVCGNKEGVIGFGFGKSRETFPAKEKAIRQAKINLFLIKKGCGDWNASQSNTNSIPFMVEGKSGSSKIKLLPAPPGTGIIAEKEVKRILQLAGVKDIWSKNLGNTKNKNNLVKATFDALKKLQLIKVNSKVSKVIGEN